MGRGAGRFVRGSLLSEVHGNEDEELESEKIDCPIPGAVIRKAGKNVMITIGYFRYIKMQFGSEA